MTANAGILPHLNLDQRDPLGGAFFAALALHVGLIGGFLGYNWWVATHKETFGSKDAGGSSVAIQTVNSIPLPHHGPENRLATDTDSEVPMTPPKPVERTKAEKPPPDAVPIKSRTPKKTAEVASEVSHLRPFKQNDPYQLTSKTAPAVSSPAFAVSGAGSISAGAHNTLGDKFSGFGAQIQQLVASHWKTETVDNRIREAPTVIATFDLMRDGSVRNVQILQGSDIPPLDASVKRAILDSMPLPHLPPDFPHDQASFEFWFELKR